ncbi:MAG: hypothetical protein JNN08_17380 [Bryobacterales bacterium]|nr:hypothetical protein [Bryobacterales bacterium]
MTPLVSLLLPYALLVVIIGLCLALFVLVKADVRRHASRWTREREELLETQHALKTQISALEEAVRTREERAETTPPAPAAPVRLSLNLQRRAQILRLAKRGDRADQISATLNMPQKEVELFLKLQSGQQVCS